MSLASVSSAEAAADAKKASASKPLICVELPFSASGHCSGVGCTIPGKVELQPSSERLEVASAASAQRLRLMPDGRAALVPSAAGRCVAGATATAADRARFTLPLLPHPLSAWAARDCITGAKKAAASKSSELALQVPTLSLPLLSLPTVLPHRSPAPTSVCTMLHDGLLLPLPLLGLPGCAIPFWPAPTPEGRVCKETAWRACRTVSRIS
mmetsp:Transcript_22355/g.66617  ORF Transcript_22355/g.66617 Transcript_22355/m.66617 type:complete len:211 (-) Transcript_22355:1227-1859(-)